MAENVVPSTSSNEDEKNIRRAEINNFIQTLHTIYEVEKMPSIRRLTLQKRIFDENDRSKFHEDDVLKWQPAAIEFKRIGDAHFCRGEYQYAILAYTKSLAFAEVDSEEVGHAYANRSAALFKLCKYDECNRDIMRALSTNYPEDKKGKLRERKERCLFFLEPNSASTGAATKSDQKQLECLMTIRSVNDAIEIEWSKLCLDLVKNPLLRRTSNKVKLECDETWGRQMVAVEDIEAGEILSCERYFSMLVPRSLRYKNCSYCLKICDALIPCPWCNEAMYCDTFCRVRALESYHRVECLMLRCREWWEECDEYENFALRVLLIGTDQGAGLRTLMKKMTVYDIFAEKIDPTDKPFCSDYLATLRLWRKFDQPISYLPSSKPEMIVKIIMALQEVGYFGSRSRHLRKLPQRRMTDAELFAALLLHNHLMSMRVYAYQLTECQDLVMGQVRRRNVGLGLTTLQNLINHSCDPNSCLMTRHRESVLFAGRFIPKGSQIFIAYFDTYAISSLSVRQNALSNPFGDFRFKCQCVACIYDWPLYPTLRESDLMTVLTTNWKRTMINFNKILTFHTRKNISQLSRTELVQVISRLSKWLHINLDVPNVLSVDCQSLLDSCMRYFYDSSRSEHQTDDPMMLDAQKVITEIISHLNKYKVA